MKNKLFPVLFSAVALVMAACGGSGPKDPAAQLAELKEQKSQLESKIAELEKQVGTTAGAPQRIKSVGVNELKPETFRHFIDLQGKIDAEDNVAVTAKMPGTLTRILVKNGDVVKKGQLIAQLDDELMLKGLSELELQLKTAEDIYQRQKGLWDQKIGTEIQFIQAKTNKEAIEQRIATTKEQWNMTRIYAPIGGTIDMVMLKTSQSIAPGYPLCNIINLGRLKVKGDVTEAYAAKVRQGDPVVLFFPDLQKETNSRISYVSKSINNMNRTFAVECALPSGAEYRANMVTVMKIVDYQKPNAIVVPISVIQNGEEGDFVYVAEKTGDKQAVVKKAAVKQGNNYNGYVEILEGLKKGDLLITTGFQDVNNGETVSL